MFFSLSILKRRKRSPLKTTSPRSQAAMMREVEKCRAEKLRWESWLWTNHLISTFFFWVSIRSCYLYNFIHILYIFYTYFIHMLYIFIQFYTYLYQKFGLLFQSRTGDSTNSSPRFSSAFQIGKTGEDHYMDLKQLGSNTLSESTHHPFRSLCSGSFGDSCCFKTRENLNATRIPWGVCEAKHRLLSGRFHRRDSKGRAAWVL